MAYNPNALPATDPMSAIATRLAALERQMRDIQTFMQGGVTAQIPVVGGLPIAGRKGRLLMLASNNGLYKDTGTAWVGPI